MNRTLIILLIIFAGCNEIIDIGGIIINRLNNEKLDAEIFISVKNSKEKYIPNLKISILRDNDSVAIADHRITGTENPLKITLPDEQVNPVSEKTQNIIVIAEHPLVGMFQQQIPLNTITFSKIHFVEFYAGDIPDTLSIAPPYLYKQFKN